MVLVEWKDEFALGVAEIDEEHKEMIGLINEAYSHLHGSKLTMGDFLGEIYTKIAAHFALEENLMREQAYDEYEEHKADHEGLLDVIRDLMDDLEDDEVVDEEAFAVLLRDWFTEHFKTRDARLHSRLG